jgi:hypothetical protein
MGLSVRRRCRCDAARYGAGLGPAFGGLNGLTGGLTGGLPSVSQADPANVAGLLQYCIQSDYLSSGVAGPAESGLLAKLPGAQQNSDYTAGSSGLLQISA